MKIVKPSVEIITNIDGNQILKSIELAARTCYKTEEKITEGPESAIKMIKKLIEMDHTAMLEFADVHVRIVSDTGFLKDITRMRVSSYAAECLSGDTKILKNVTIKQLYDKFQKKYNQLNTIRSVNENGDIIPHKVKDVWYKGKADVYEVTTSLGYSIKSTMNHYFKTESGEYRQLKQISEGDKVFVNGRPSLVKISDEELEKLYETYNIGEISDLIGVSESSVMHKLKKLGIFVPRKNDSHNKEKYNKNHTEESYKKMRESCLQTYRNGRIPWNKGIRYYEHPSVALQRESLIKNHHYSEKYKYRYQTQDDCSRCRIYDDIGKATEYECELCGRPAKEWHHIDKNERNNYRDNLMALCIECHKKLHNGWWVGKREHLDKIVSIKYCGIEDVYDIEMEQPYDNFIANGFVVHNSTRWCNYSKGKFNSELTFIEPINIKPDTPEYMIWYKTMKEIEESYMKMSQLGCKPDQMRMILPHSTKTEVNIKTNIREWRHIFGLRCHKAAHPSVRQVMLETLRLFHERIPVLFDDLYETFKEDILSNSL